MTLCVILIIRSLELMEKIPAFIFARGGSKGLKNKNIKEFNSRPLIYWTIKELKKSKLVDKIFVSTDSKKIKKIAESFGATVPFLRPKKLSLDKSPEILAWKHALEFLKKKNEMPKIFFSCPVTSPLRKANDIDAMIKLFYLSKADTVVGVTNSHRSPYFNMMKEKKNKSLSIIIKKSKQIYNRQECPKTFDLTTFGFIVKTKNIFSKKSIFDGNVKGYEVNKNISIDIDDLFDFKFAEYLMKNNVKL